jgi:hypothetical protein
MKARRRPARSPFTASTIEQLESRQLLAATLSGGVLTVDGSARADNIRVQLAGANIVVHLNNATRSFARSSVNSINIDGKAGNDKINVVNRQLLNVVIQGGAGNDNIVGGGAGDLITGGAGNDRIRGRGGDDQVYGGAGRDNISGDAGNDTLGGDDEDTIWAKNATRPADIGESDTLNGGAGNDWLLSGTESDLNNDISGADVLTGGAGVDVTDIRGRDNTANHYEVGTGDGDTITDTTDTSNIIPADDVTGPVDENSATPYSQHKHAFLKININGNDMVIPDFVGQFNGEPVVHTHDLPSHQTPPQTDDVRGMQLHFHNTPTSGGTARVFTLGDFFEHWGISFSSQNIGRFRVDAKHELVMTVKPKGGAAVSNTQFNNYAIQTDNYEDDSTKFDQIVITYRLKP